MVVVDQEVTKPENGTHQENSPKEETPDHEDAVKDAKAERTTEPSASSSSEADLQVTQEMGAVEEKSVKHI